MLFIWYLNVIPGIFHSTLSSIFVSSNSDQGPFSWRFIFGLWANGTLLESATSTWRKRRFEVKWPGVAIFPKLIFKARTEPTPTLSSQQNVKEPSQFCSRYLSASMNVHPNPNQRGILGQNLTANMGKNCKTVTCLLFVSTGLECVSIEQRFYSVKNKISLYTVLQESVSKFFFFLYWRWCDCLCVLCLQTEEEKRRNSFCCEYFSLGWSCLTQWETESWAGHCDNRALVHGTRCKKNRNSTKWNCRDIIPTSWWEPERNERFLRNVLAVIYLSSSALTSYRSRSISSHVGSLGNGWRIGRVPLCPVCIQGLC